MYDSTYSRCRPPCQNDLTWDNVNEKCNCATAGKVLDGYRSKCTDVLTAFADGGLTMNAPAPVSKLGGPLSSRLTCDSVTDIKTPFSEGMIDISGLHYVEFMTDWNVNSGATVKLIWFLDQANYDILKTKIDVTDNTNSQCTSANT